MTDPQRYFPPKYGGEYMAPDENGDYVEWDDYLELRAKLEAVTKWREALSLGGDIHALTQEELHALAALIPKMTPAPWIPEKSWAHTNDDTVHWSIRTVEKMPDTPWSARYIAWLTGALGHHYGASQIPYRFCDACKHGYFKQREAAVEVRVDEGVEADVNGIVALRNAAPSLLRTVEAAMAVSKVYYELASEVIGEDEVRRRHAEMLSRAAAIARGDGGAEK